MLDMQQFKEKALKEDKSFILENSYFYPVQFDNYKLIYKGYNSKSISLNLTLFAVVTASKQLYLSQDIPRNLVLPDNCYYLSEYAENLELKINKILEGHSWDAVLADSDCEDARISARIIRLGLTSFVSNSVPLITVGDLDAVLILIGEKDLENFVDNVIIGKENFYANQILYRKKVQDFLNSPDIVTERELALSESITNLACNYVQITFNVDDQEITLPASPSSVIFRLSHDDIFSPRDFKNQTQAEKVFSTLTRRPACSDISKVTYRTNKIYSV